ncbi:ABC transporter ATP-binding protein [Desulfonauticus submarinus]
MLKVVEFSLTLSNFLLQDINLEVQEGEFFALIGPTGSGKTLLLESLMGVFPSNCQFKGNIFLNKKNITYLPPEKRGLGIVYQHAALFPHLTVKENILFGFRYKKQKKNLKELDFLIQKLGIAHLLNRFPNTLSGGEQQRVALARALVLRPKAILLDEPLSALDPNFQEEIRELLKNLHKDLNITFIMVSHNFSEVLYLAERGAIIRNGQIEQIGTISQIFNHPNSSFVADFVGVKNIFSAQIKKDVAIINNTLKIKIPIQKQKFLNYIAIRPEAILLLNNSNNNHLENCFTGIVKKIFRKGFYFEFIIEVDSVEFKSFLTKKDLIEMIVKEGDKIKIGFRAKDVHCFYEKL